MFDAKFFTHPRQEWQRRYEALRASFVDRCPAKVVADRFGYSPEYVNLMRHQFRRGKIDLAGPVGEGKSRRRGISAETREKIRHWRDRRLSAGEIAELLHQEGLDVSVRTVERVLAEEGYAKLPRRTQLKIGLTVEGAMVPDRAHFTTLAELEGQTFESDSAGIFLFAPFLEQLDIQGVVNSAAVPGTKAIPPLSRQLAFLGLKLLGTERYSHVGKHSFDPALGAFAGLNVLPKCTEMSTYSYSLDEVHLGALREKFVKNAAKLGLYRGDLVNLDFHTVPHFGEESVLEKHWAGARNKAMKGALTLIAQDAESTLMLYTDADIHRDEADAKVMDFLAFWKSVRRGVKPTLVFDSRFTTYERLSELNAQGVKFITLRRRGKNLLKSVDALEPWHRIDIPHPKRKFRRPLVHDGTIALHGYQGQIRQVVIRGNGREEPTFLISNDFDNPVELLVGNYARRWRVENGIAEAVKFFHLNALSSPILTKVSFDVLLTMFADTLYSMLAAKLRGFEDCDAPTLFRHFVRGKGTVSVKNGLVSVVFPRRAHNPILRSVPWHRLPRSLPALHHATLEFKFL